MYKKVITFTDLNGETRSEEYMFHLSKARILEMELRHEGGVEGYIEAIAAAQDRNEIVDFIKKFIEMSYGIKTADGGFDQSPEVIQRFVQSEAYSELFTELLTDSMAAARFINGIMPKEQRDPKSLSENQNVVTIEKAKEQALERINQVRAEEGQEPIVERSSDE